MPTCREKGFTEILSDCAFMYADNKNYDYCQDGVPGNMVCFWKKKVKKQDPKPDDPNKKKKKKETPKNLCKNDNGNTLDPIYIDERYVTNNFKNFLIKYYPDLVAKEEGGEQKLKDAKKTDCNFVRLWNKGDSRYYGLIIGGYIYDDWVKFVGGETNAVSKTKDEYDKWISNQSNKNNNNNNQKEKEKEKDSTSLLDGTWTKLIDNGWVSNKGVQVSLGDISGILYKVKSIDGDYRGKKVEVINFDNELQDNKLSIDKLKENINYTDDIKYGFYPEIFYAVLTYPTENIGEDKTEYPLTSKRYVVIEKKDASGNDILTISNENNYVRTIKIKNPDKVIKVNESIFSKVLLEKIRKKNKLNEAPNPDPGTGGDDDDLFAFSNPTNNLTSKDAIKNFIIEKTPIIQKQLIDKGARSNYFYDWNATSQAVGAGVQLNLPVSSKTAITRDNQYIVSQPAQSGGYKSEPFYMVLGLTGDPTKNKATIFTPVNVTEKQKYISSSSDPAWCKTQLINYLKIGLKHEFISDKADQWKKMREICDCNLNGGFENFKKRGKDEDYGKTTWRKDRLNIKRGESVFRTVTKNAEGKKEVNDLTSAQSPFLPVFNKYLNWKEIVDLIHGKSFKTKQGNNSSIQPNLIITGFDKGGLSDLCNNEDFRRAYEYQETQKESFEDRIKNRISESIKIKNIKLVETTLKNILRNRF